MAAGCAIFPSWPIRAIAAISPGLNVASLYASRAAFEHETMMQLRPRTRLPLLLDENRLVADSGQVLLQNFACSWGYRVACVCTLGLSISFLRLKMTEHSLVLPEESVAQQLAYLALLGA